MTERIATTLLRYCVTYSIDAPRYPKHPFESFVSIGGLHPTTFASIPKIVALQRGCEPEQITFHNVRQVPAE